LITVNVGIKERRNKRGYIISRCEVSSKIKMLWFGGELENI
jgi:hypothetical protein